MLYCGIFIYFYIPNTSYSISHYIIKIFVIIFLGSQESLFVTLTFFQSQLCLLNFCFYFLTQTKRISHYALVVREKKTINFIKIIKNHKIKTTILYVLWCAISICLCLAFPDREQRAAQLQKKMEEKQNQEVMHKVKNSAQEENIEKVPPKQ